MKCSVETKSKVIFMFKDKKYVFLVHVHNTHF